MDRRRARAARLIAAGLAAIALVAAVAAPRLRAEAWLAPATRLEALTTEPGECSAPARDAREAALLAIGRTAFRTPALLGGQAARAGLTCAACHPGGHDNPAFLLNGLSGTPGTADVTSSLMSSHRGNGVFDPQPIPDLARPGKVSREGAALDTFVHGLVTEEFDGAEPPPAALRGLLAYLRAMRPCPTSATVPITLDRVIADIESGVAAAGFALADGDAASARLMLAGARSMLGQIDERYAPAGLKARRAELRRVDRGLLALQSALDHGDAPVRLAQWRFPPSLKVALRRAESRSLYDRAVLSREIG